MYNYENYQSVKRQIEERRQNAIAQASKLGVSVECATMYVTHQPCTICTRIIINSGIKRIIYRHSYPDDFSVQLLKDAGVELIKFQE